MKLFKTTITILSEYNPEVTEVAYDDLVTDAMEGGSYCTGTTTEEVDCETFEDGVRDFFNCSGKEEEEE